MLRIVPRPLASQSDAQLLRACPNDPDAFLEVYNRWAATINGWLVRRAGDRTIAADLTAEAFAEALRHAARFRDDADGSAGPWLFGIAANLLRRSARQAEVETRARQRLGMSLVPLTDDLPDATVERITADDAAAALSAALDELPAAQRQAVLLRVVDDLDYDEIAALQATTNQAVRSRVSRGLRRIRRRLENQ